MYDQTSMRMAEYHFSMLLDAARVAAFRRAVEAVVRPGDVVMDLGSGTGLLAFMALRAGARCVYAVEEGVIIALAQEVARANGLADRVVWLHDRSTRVTLPEPVDVVLSETIGNFGLDEGIVEWLADAARRHLKPGGRVVPQGLTLWAAPVELPAAYAYVRAWDAPLAGFDFGPAKHVAANLLYFAGFGPEALLGPGRPWAAVRLPEASPHAVAGSVTLECRRGGALHGIGGWFEADLAPGVAVSNGPEAATTSWSRGFLPLGRAVEVQPGDQVEVTLAAHANGSLWRWQGRCVRPTPGGPVLLATFSHHTLAGQLVPIQTLRKRRAESTPTLTPLGEAKRFAMAQMDGQTSLQEIADRLMARFPERFSRWEDALSLAGDVAARYGH
ncbi:MAG: 50S ribosomal protein L11 methyltransferase [Caldilineales bacterium]|nr:50S ribosomal protein L11 methyltransferase [Caldilineales bacterium]